MSDIKVVRLISGEELVCEVSYYGDLNDEFLTLRDIAILIPTDQHSLGLAQYLSYTMADVDGLTVRKSQVLFTARPTEGLMNKYQEMFSKIMTPQKSILTN
jgi:hypothetical protein